MFVLGKAPAAVQIVPAVEKAVSLLPLLTAMNPLPVQATPVQVPEDGNDKLVAAYTGGGVESIFTVAVVPGINP